MVIRVFVFILLVFSAISYFIPVEQKNKTDLTKDIPLLTFHDSTMYTLTPESMNRIVYTKEAMRYNNRDVMHNGALTLKGKDKDKNETTDVVYADVIIKRGETFKFLNNVKYKRDEYITLNTNELIYDSKSKIATNSVPFDGIYYSHIIKGTNLYMEIENNYMKSKNAYFEVDIEEK